VRENAEADYHRARAEEGKARADKAVAERQLLVLDAREKQIRAALAQAQAGLDMARLNLSYTEIRALLMALLATGAHGLAHSLVAVHNCFLWSPVTICG
jgi:outer membrane protein TolC